MGRHKVDEIVHVEVPHAILSLAHTALSGESNIRRIEYPYFLRQPFTNQAYRKELLSLGTVHVAVGFVDLGVLLSCELCC